MSADKKTPTPRANPIFRFLRPTAIGALLVLSSCDFQAAQDAFDDFDLVIGLEPINTVVNGIVTDNTNDELVAATLTFTGEDAAGIIDAYSDPVSRLDAESGVITFGIQNNLVPTGADPVAFTVTASAPGYFTTSRTVQIVEPGDAEFRMSLTRTDPTAVVQGTSSIQSTSVQVTSTGATTQTTIIETQTPSQTESLVTASLNIPAGTRALAVDGTPLTGQITTSLRAYDSQRGLQSLPASARTLPDGTQPLILGAVHFKMVDESGKVAVSFDRPSGKKLGKSASTCGNGGNTAIRMDITPPSDGSGGFEGMDYIDVLGSTEGGGSSVIVGVDIPLQFHAFGAFADLCLDGSDQNVITQTVHDQMDGDDGLFFTALMKRPTGVTGRMSHRLTIHNPSPVPTAVEMSMSYMGGSSRSVVTVPPGSTEKLLAGWFSDYGVKVFDEQHAARLNVRTADGKVVAAMIWPNPSTGVSSLTLPSGQSQQTYDIVASLECANPATQKFDVRVTNESLDAVTAMYRVAGNGGTWNVINTSAISSKEASDAAISIRGALSLLPNTVYEFKGVLGANSANATATSPGSGSTFTIKLDPDDVGLSCKSR